MTTKWCHQCGSEFLARVESCPDCGIQLAADAPGAEAAPPSEAGVESGEQLAYELHEWSEEHRRHLDSLLRGQAMPFAWQGTDLLVPAGARALIEDLLDEVDASTRLALDPDADKVAYDLSDLDDEGLQDLFDALGERGIPHGYAEETEELVVHEADDEQVEEVLEAVDFPDALPVDEDADSGDGLDAAEVLSGLFVAADRLRRHAADPDGVLGLVAAADAADRLGLPFGFEAAVWEGLVERASGLAALIEDDDASDDAIEEQAAELRDALRPYV